MPALLLGAAILPEQSGYVDVAVVVYKVEKTRHFFMERDFVDSMLESRDI